MMMLIDILAPSYLAFVMPSGIEWVVLLALGLLIFGRRLPEVGRWLGQGIVEFKRGIKGIDEEIEQQSSRTPDRLPDQPAKSATGGTVENTTPQEH